MVVRFGGGSVCGLGSGSRGMQVRSTGIRVDVDCPRTAGRRLRLLLLLRRLVLPWLGGISSRLMLLLLVWLGRRP